MILNVHNYVFRPFKSSLLQQKEQFFVHYHFLFCLQGNGGCWWPSRLPLDESGVIPHRLPVCLRAAYQQITAHIPTPSLGAVWRHPSTQKAGFWTVGGSESARKKNTQAGRTCELCTEKTQLGFKPGPQHHTSIQPEGGTVMSGREKVKYGKPWQWVFGHINNKKQHILWYFFLQSYFILYFLWI